MELDEAKQRLIQTWGSLGTCWGVNRTMAQVHALLMVSMQPLSAEDVMEQLQISRGNANMNLRALIDWGLARRECKVGERKEFFVAEKDMWRAAMQIVQERQKRELAPLLQVLAEVRQVEDTENPCEKENFIASVEKLDTILNQANQFIDFMVKTEKNWMANNLMRLLANNVLTSKDRDQY